MRQWAVILGDLLAYVDGLNEEMAVFHERGNQTFRMDRLILLRCVPVPFQSITWLTNGLPVSAKTIRTRWELLDI